MKQLILMLLCLAFAASATAAEDRVLTLPQDQGTWYLTVFGNPDAEFQTLTGWLESDKELAKLKSQVRYNEYTTDQVRYQRYAKDIPGLPCIRLQNEKGLVVSEYWGTNIPTDSGKLYKGIKSDFSNKTTWGCPRRGCPTPTPTPTPEPVVIVDVNVPTGPPVLEEEGEEPSESNLWMLLVLLAAVASGSLSFVQSYRKESEEKSGPTSSKF